MEGTVAGVRIVPPVVEFFDAEADVVHQMALTVQNLSKCSRNIRYHSPATSVSTNRSFEEHHTVVCCSLAVA